MAIKITQNGISEVQDNTVNSDKIPDNSISYNDLHEGAVLQTVNLVSSAQGSYTIGTSDTNHPGGEISITPKLSNSLFLIHVRYFMEVANGWDVVFNIKKNGTRINNLDNNRWHGLTMPTISYSGAADNNSTPELVEFSTLDTSGSSSGVVITYNLVSSSGGNKTCFYNRCFSTTYEKGVSEIIIQEIKGY
jgi:hypothetical protein